MDESASITQKILLSILEGNQNVTDVRINTGLHPNTLSKYLNLLTKQGLINISKNWKRGKSKPCLITDSGIKWLVNIPVNDNLQIILKIAEQLKNPKIREGFQRVTAEKYSHDTKLIKDHFIESMLKKKSPDFNIKGLNPTDFNEPFREVLKKMLALHIFLSFSPVQNFQELEDKLEKDFVLFAPQMEFWFSWHRGAYPDLEYQLGRIENQFLYNPENLGFDKENRPSSKETHLMGLEWVDEKIYEQYIKTKSKKKREEILAKIETQVEWSVGKYLRELTIGKEEIIAKYVNVQERPFLMKFISTFQS